MQGTIEAAEVLKAWLEANKNLIEVFYLPSYSPDLNPDEFMNSDLKSHLNKQPDARAKGKLEMNFQMDLGLLRRWKSPSPHQEKRKDRLLHDFLQIQWRCNSW